MSVQGSVHRSVHRVAVLALDAVVPLDMSIAAELFSERDDTPYRMTLCGVTVGAVPTSAGFSLHAPGGLADARRADTVIVPGFTPHLRAPQPEVLDLLAEMHGRGRRVVSICIGAFALAAAGVLDGRTATTHWRHTRELAARYPSVQVNGDVLYVDEGTVLTSAGVAAGIDLCLHIIRRDLGATIANRIARDIVAAPYRDGGQAQYVRRAMPAETGAALAATRAWILEHLGEPLTVQRLARRASMSERTFARRFVAETGVPPLQWVQNARVDRARELLEHSDLSIEQITRRCGLGTPANFRTIFRRSVGTSPGRYRKTFAEPTGRAGAPAN